MATGRSHSTSPARPGRPAPWTSFRSVLPEACPACGGPLAPWREAPAAEPPHAPVALWRCGVCGTAVTDAPPGSHETGAYGPGAPRLARAAAPVLAAFDRRRLA